MGVSYSESKIGSSAPPGTPNTVSTPSASSMRWKMSAPLMPARLLPASFAGIRIFFAGARGVRDLVAARFFVVFLVAITRLPSFSPWGGCAGFFVA